MALLRTTRRGAGAPLVLLHGLGGSRGVWDPVIPELAEQFDVIAIDLPGFGGSEPLPEEVEPHPAALAAAVAAFLDDIGVAAPHVAGNSLGGWVALELAAIRPVASLALLSPAGLWRGATPRYDRISLRAIRWGARHAAGLLAPLVGFRLGRMLVLAQTHGRPWRMTPDQARSAIHDMGTCPGFTAVMRATDHRCYRAGAAAIEAPVRVAFGSRDLILLPHQARHLDELPPGTRLESLRGCGHVPMTDDPDAVAAFIASAAGQPAAPRSERSPQPGASAHRSC